MGTEIFPGRECAAAAHPPARAGRNAHRGDRAHRAPRARRHPARSRAGQRRDHQRFRGRRALQLSGEPDSSVHQRAAGSHHPGRAEARTRRAAKPLREKLRDSLRQELPDCQVSFEAGDIVSQVMSFGSPTPIEVAVQGISLPDDYAYAQKVRAQMAKLDFPARSAVRPGAATIPRSTSPSTASAPDSSA